MARPHTVNRMALMLLMLFLFTAGSLHATTLVNENFNYATGQLTSYNSGANVSGGNWVSYASGTYYIQVVSGNLTYTSYPASGAGNMLHITSPTAAAEDVRHDFTPQPIGSSVYVGFLLNLTNTTGLAADTSTNGDYLAALLPSTSTTTYVHRLSIRRSSTTGDYQLGVKASANTAALWNTTSLTPGTTHLVVLKYVMVSGANNDSCLLWIDPALAAAEPTAQTAQIFSSGTEPGDLGRFAIRQGNNTSPVAATPNADIDGIIVGTQWTDLTPFSTPSVLATAPANNDAGVPTYAVVTATFDRAMNVATVDAASFTLTGVKQATYLADSIIAGNGNATFTFYVRDSLRKSDTVTATLTTAIADPNGTHLPANYSWNFYTVLPETIRPYLVSSVPDNGTNHVTITSPIVLNFSEQLLPASVDTHTIWVQGRRTPRYRLTAPTLSNGNATVTVHLADTLFYKDTVTVHITAGVSDVQANAARDTSFTFSTALQPGLTIYDVQYAPITGMSAYNGQTVTVTGVVTAVVAGGTYNGAYFLQDGSGPWNGIYVYGTSNGARVGDSARITGAVQEYGTAGTITEIAYPTYTLLKSGCRLPDPVVVTTGLIGAGGTNAEPYEGVLVKTGPATVTSVVTGSNDGYMINDGSGDCPTGNFIGTYATVGYSPVAGDTLVQVKGICNFNRVTTSSSVFGIEPRMIGDVMDNKPVKVITTIPAAGSINVPTSVGVTINYNKPVRTDSVTAGHFRLTGSISGPIAFTASYDTLTWSSFLVPAHNFAQRETVSVTVFHTVVDTMGHGLDGNGNGVSVNDSTDDYHSSFVTVGNLLTIAQVQQPDAGGYNSAMVGQTVTMQGVITGPAKYFSSSTWSNSASLYIQDATSGANIFVSGATFGDARIGPESALGTLCVVTGTVTEYSGVTEITTDITNMAFWGKAPQLPVPDTMIYNQFMTEDMEGKLMCVGGTVSSPPSYAGGGYNMEIRNGDAPIAIRFSETSEFDINSLPIGTKVQIIGVASQYDKYPIYDAGYQIVPRFKAPYTYVGVQYPADITIVTDSIAALESAQIVSYTPNPFCPDWGEVVTINVNGPLSDHLTLTVYDLKGRLVKTLLNNVPGGHQVCIWDGKDNAHRPANIGMYIMHLRSVSSKGNVVDKNKIIVLGTPLK